MRSELSPQQAAIQDEARVFVDREVVPLADRIDREERTPPELIGKLADQGYLGGFLAESVGGRGWDLIAFGLVCEEVGRGCASLMGLLTVQAMVSSVLMKWGTDDQKAQWVPRLASGRAIAALALTEPEIGSDAGHIRAEAAVSDDGYRLNGQKKWISYGQVADLFLVIAQCGGAPTAFLVEKGSPGLSIVPIRGMLGFRGGMLAELHFNDCPIPQANLVGRTGFGFSHVAGTALDLGRYCIAWGSTGLSQACLESSLRYAAQRVQFGAPLRDHQLIQKMLANMMASTQASRLLCLDAGRLRESNDADSIMAACIAKYFASKAAVQAALDAVQIHGANGCGPDLPVERYLRDAKILEIIEGSSQIQEMLIAKFGHLRHVLRRKK